MFLLSPEHQLKQGQGKSLPNGDLFIGLEPDDVVGPVKGYKH
jgi:hypothetical protein